MMRRVIIVGSWLGAALGQAVNPNLAKRNARMLTCGKDAGANLPDGKAGFDEMELLFQETTVLSQLESKHVVMIVPATVARQTGGSVTAQALASLPSKSPTVTKMTKVVVVGHALKEGGLEGIVVGRDVCNPDLIDKTAANWWREQVPETLGSPQILNPKEAASCCPDLLNPTLDQQMSYLSTLWYDEDADQKQTKFLKGNILPIMIEKQTYKVAAHLADALAMLVAGPDGPWLNERVLFLFASDFSHGLDRNTALTVDKETVAKITGSGFGPTATYMQELQKKCTATVCDAPQGYSCILAAMKLASGMGMVGRSIRTTNSGEFEGDPTMNQKDPVRGYATIAFVKDTRSKGEQISGGPGENTPSPTGPTAAPVVPTVDAPGVIEFLQGHDRSFHYRALDRRLRGDGAPAE